MGHYTWISDLEPSWNFWNNLDHLRGCDNSAGAATRIHCSAPPCSNLPCSNPPCSNPLHSAPPTMYMHAQQERSDTASASELDPPAFFLPDIWEHDDDRGTCTDPSRRNAAAPTCSGDLWDGQLPAGSKGLVSQAIDSGVESEYCELPVLLIACPPACYLFHTCVVCFRTPVVFLPLTSSSFSPLPLLLLLARTANADTPACRRVFAWSRCSIYGRPLHWLDLL